MCANAVVICLDVHEHRLSHLRRRTPPVKTVKLPLQRREKGFRARVVPALALATHALADVGAARPQRLAEGMRAILRAPVRMEYQPGKGCLFLTAIPSAATTVTPASIRSLNAQPTTLRSNRSSTTVRYSQPPRTRKHVMSETHFRPGPSAGEVSLSDFLCKYTTGFPIVFLPPNLRFRNSLSGKELAQS